MLYLLCAMLEHKTLGRASGFPAVELQMELQEDASCGVCTVAPVQLGACTGQQAPVLQPRGCPVPPSVGEAACPGTARISDIHQPRQNHSNNQKL